MDFWTQAAFSVVLALLANPKRDKKFSAVIAKVFVKIEKLAQLDQTLTMAIREQRVKEGLEQ